MPIKNTEFIATTFFGLEDILYNELEELGAEKLNKLNRAVAFQGSTAMLYKTNLHLRTAIKILKPIAKFRVFDQKSLYKGIRSIDWSKYMDNHTTFAIDTAVSSKHFNHSGFVALKSKDAIADQFRSRTGKRPSVDLKNPAVSINIHLAGENCTVSINTSGNALFKRGYRTQTGIAPLNEALAAGMIQLSGWDKKSPLLDPMCGSGTLPIEAALYARSIAPGLFRKNFGFQKLPDFDPRLWKLIKDQAEQQIRPLKAPIFASDISNKALALTRQNIENASLAGKIDIAQHKFEELKPPAPEGWIVVNPPYDERLKNQNIDELYAEIGSRLKHHFDGYQVWLLSSNTQALKHIGLRPSGKKILYNGALECRFLKYSMYKGSRKEKSNNS